MKSAEVVIIGGGIQGISLAYHLAKRGLVDVCLLEMKMLGSGSSGKSASVIGHAFQSEACLPLTRWSYRALMGFEEQVGVNPGLSPSAACCWRPDRDPWRCAGVTGSCKTWA